MAAQIPIRGRRNLSSDPWMTLGEAVRWAAWRGKPEPRWGAEESEDGGWLSHGDLEESDRIVYVHGAEEVRKALAAGKLEAWAQTGYEEPVQLSKARWSGQVLGSIVSWMEFYHPFDRIIVERARVLDLWPNRALTGKDSFQPQAPPDPGTLTLPPEGQFVTLSEALTWIAFGVSMDSDRLHEVLGMDTFRKSIPQEAIKDAVARLTALASGSKVALRGKYRESRIDDDGTLLTAPIEPIKLEDYCQFSYLDDELRHGEGMLFWRDTDGTILDHIVGGGRKDSFLQVKVDRADLLREFPPRERALSERTIFEPGITFSRDEPGTIAPWWTVNQALAWIVTRIPAYIAAVGRSETVEPREHRPYIVHAICESQVAESDDGKAFMASRRATWPTGTFLAHAGRALLEKIQSGEVKPATSESGRGRPMDWHEFVGVGTTETGADWLDVDPPPLFSSAELMRAFPASELEPAGNGGGIVPANRQLDHPRIIAKACAMLSEQPNLSKGSAAASIVAELPPNPRTGRPRDTRHIERLIAHLWEGKVS